VTVYVLLISTSTELFYVWINSGHLNSIVNFLNSIVNFLNSIVNSLNSIVNFRNSIVNLNHSCPSNDNLWF